jgi:ribosome-associated toxin RatA of RatAB toxin-antitoxin module
MPGASRSVTINAPIEQVFKTVTDYDHYGEFLPEVKGVRSSDRKGAEVLVHYELKLMKTIHYTLKMREEAPKRIFWTLEKGEMMKANQGSWTFEAKSPTQTLATYQIEITLGPLVPKTLVNALVDTSLPKMLEAFKQRAEQSS